MKFTDQLWQMITPIYHQIIQHPFNIELGIGTLDRQRFDFYLEQDAHYLMSYSRALSFIAARAGSSSNIQWFLTFALKALAAERELHTNFFPPNYSWDNVEPSPTCIAYTQHIIALAATAAIEEAIAAILPCLWVYREVGRHTAVSAVETNPYIDWIKTYTNIEFSNDTDQAIAILDGLASHCAPQQLARMKKVFEYSALFEWHFWNDSYQMTLFRESTKDYPNLITPSLEVVSVS
jgi:thiaminase/transcriptional activator TenA